MVFKLSWLPYIAILGGILFIFTEGRILWGACLIILGVVLIPVFSGSQNNTSNTPNANNINIADNTSNSDSINNQSSDLENINDDAIDTYTPNDPKPYPGTYDEATDSQNHTATQRRAKFCPHCGEKANENYAFCIKCGNKLPTNID